MTLKKAPPPPPSRTTVRLPEAVHRRAKLAAVWSGQKIQDFVAVAVERLLAEVEPAMRSLGGDGSRAAAQKVRKAKKR